MTIQIIRKASLGLEPGAIRTLDASTEAALIADKEAISITAPNPPGDEEVVRYDPTTGNLIGARGQILSSVSGAGVSVRRVVGTKGWLPGGLTEFSAVDAVLDTRAAIKIPRKCSMLSIPYLNISQTVNVGEKDGPNDITVKGAIETGSTYIPLTFGGKRTVTIEPGGIAWSDPVAYSPADAEALYLRTRVTCAAGGKIPLGRYLIAGDGGGVVVGGSDQCYATGALTGGAAGYAYTAGCVVGNVPTVARVPAVAFFGDSIFVGAADTTDPTSGLRGFTERALGASFAYVTSACSGGSLAIYAARHWRAWSALSGVCDYAIIDSAINDCKNGKATPGPTLMAMKANAWAIWSELRWVHGIIPTHTTATPYEASDGVSDAAVESVRVPWNEWLRDGAPYTASTGETVRVGHALHPLAYVHEIADLAETARNSGLWRATYINRASFDGTHPVLAGHVALAAGINTSVFV